MDSTINAAARALAAGDPLAALDRVALRGDAAALALRGIAMAQLGELARARQLLRDAIRAFEPAETIARARCIVAQTEVALALRELSGFERELDDALTTLEAAGDVDNATQARLVRLRRRLLLGRVDQARAELRALPRQPVPPMHAAVAQLLAAELAMRSVDAEAAAEALALAAAAAHAAGIEPLSAEVAAARRRLDAPAGRQRVRGQSTTVSLTEVQALLASRTLVVDACRRIVTFAGDVVSLARRPVLFQIAAVLADAWPDSAPRGELIASVFGSNRGGDAWRARLRVEVGRLRKLVRAHARVEATADGFQIVPVEAESVALLVPPVDGEHAAVVALLADGAAWSTSALALALGVSPRTVQRALVSLCDDGRVRTLGRGRAQRWLAPASAAFTTALLLPGVVAT
ncbi:MAG: helix-turn-helix domain-containing protein [Myxococcota bacterium]